ncbi:hypothetical protein KM043_001649 [Ampulex compressa]|nr:hypothetical protein KM043_001649 [Ampulex compressa]
MLKWTVSRSLSASSSTPHGPATLTKAPRRPFRDLSNTPPAATTKTRHVPKQNGPENASARITPARRRRCRSHGSDLRSYFQATKPNLRTSKRQSVSQEPEKSAVTESFYQSTPRVDADIGPLMFVPTTASRCSTALTLPTDPSLFVNSRGAGFQSDKELPQNIVNEARANLRSHVSDFFQQISMATSPEDVMDAASVPLTEGRIYSQNCEARVKFAECGRAGYAPKLARLTKIHARCKTPYRAKVSPFKAKVHGQTPLIGKLSSLAIDQDLPNYENMDNTVTEILNKEQEINFSGKTVAEILLGDVEERKKVLEDSCDNQTSSKSLDHTYETIVDREDIAEDNLEEEEEEEEGGMRGHNDSSVSSASQLLEDPSPMSWAFASPPNDLDGEFTLKRQRGIRRKRHRKDTEKILEEKRAKRRSTGEETSQDPSAMEEQVLAEAVNLNVKKLALETDLDSTLEEKEALAGKGSRSSLEDRKEEGVARKAGTWDLDSPKSSLMDDFQSSKSFPNSASNTPEAPLVATVRRCLKFSPESEPPRINCRGSIEIEYSVLADRIHVRGKFFQGSRFAHLSSMLRGWGL